MFISQFNFYFNYAWLEAGTLQEVAINAIAKYKANPEYRTSEVKLLRTSQYQIIYKSLLPEG